MITVPFAAEVRDTAVKAKALRQEGKIPAVLYGPNIIEHFTVKPNDVKHLIFTPDFKLGQVDLGGKTHRCIVKAIQYHPVTDNIRHIDFLAVQEGTKVKIELPVKFTGESPGVKEGGKLMQSLRRIKVKLDPANIIDHLTIDISHLELGDAVRVRDIVLPENVEIMVNEAVPVAIVEVPRALKAEEAAAAEGQDTPAEGAEGEDAKAE